MYINQDDINSEEFDYADSILFRVDNVLVVNSDDRPKIEVLFMFEQLGFATKSVNSLEEAFCDISENPEDFALICIHLDTKIGVSTLSSFIRLFRLTQPSLPTLVLSCSKNENYSGYPRFYRDSIVRFPEAVSQLSIGISRSLRDNLNWRQKALDCAYDRTNPYDMQGRRSLRL